MPTASAPQIGHLKTPNHRPPSHFGLFHLFLTRLMARVRALTGRVVQLPPPQPPFHRPSAVLIRYQLSGYLHTCGEMYIDVPSKSCTSSYQTPPLQLLMCKNPYLIIQNSVYNQRVRHRYRLCLCLHIPMSLSSTSLGLHDKYNSQCMFDRLAFLMILTNGIDTARALATVHGILALHRVTTYPLGRSRYQARLVYSGTYTPQHQHQLVFYPFLHPTRTWPVCTG